MGLQVRIRPNRTKPNKTETQPNPNQTKQNQTKPNQTNQIALQLQCEVEDAVSSNHSTVLDPDDPNCVYPEYFVYSIYVILLGMAFTIQLRYLIRILLIVICLLISTFQQTVEYAALFNYYDTAVYSK